MTREDKMSLPLSEIYDRFAATYEQNRGLFDMHDVMNDFWQRVGNRKGHLLDLGCGAGEPFGAFFLEQGWRVTGVDFSANMLALAGQWVPAMKRVTGDMRTVEFDAQQFDAVSSIYSFFHLPFEDQAVVLKNVKRWLVPGGRFLFTYATENYTGHERFSGYKRFMGEDLFYSHGTPHELDAMLDTAGFKNESSVYREIGGETFLWVTALSRDIGENE
jgi:ubiquinone/menaquinone biosynthesis C-methylase UbiE